MGNNSSNNQNDNNSGFSKVCRFSQHFLPFLNNTVVIFAVASPALVLWKSFWLFFIIALLLTPLNMINFVYSYGDNYKEIEDKKIQWGISAVMGLLLLALGAATVSNFFETKKSPHNYICTLPVEKFELWKNDLTHEITNELENMVIADEKLLTQEQIQKIERHKQSRSQESSSGLSVKIDNVTIICQPEIPKKQDGSKQK